MARSGHVNWTFTLLPLFLCAICLAVYQVCQAPSPGSLQPKIFVLGLSKTGTTSIGDALERLGYRRLGWRDIRSRHMVHTWAHGDLTSLVELTRYFDAFEDLPWPRVYREMAELYPDARFILSLRKDEETWLRSMRAHVGRGKWLPHTYFYGADSFEGEENERLIGQSYQNHTRDVRQYFADQPNRYLEMNIDDGDVNWGMLCRVANCPDGKTPVVGFPKSNTVESWNMGFLAESMNWWKGWLITRTEERVSQYYYEQRGRAFLKPLLHVCWNAYDIVDRIYTEVYFNQLVQPPLRSADSEKVSSAV